ADCYRDMVEVDDPPLSTFSREQARRLAERVRRANPAAVYSSPYRRAMETARAITDDVQIDERLVEVSLEIDEDGALDFKEMPDVAAARMGAVVDDVGAKHTGELVVVGGHGAALSAGLPD